MKSLFLFVTTLFLSSIVYSGIIVVVNTSDSGPGSLRQAVIDAVDGDTIRFDPAIISSGSDTILFNNEIDFSKGLTFKGLIDGPDTLFLSGQGTENIFDANLGINSTKKLVLDSMTFIDAFVSPNGGAVYFQGEEIEILNCTFRNNTAVGSGAAVFIQSFNVITSKSVGVLIENSVFKYNLCWNGGSAAVSVGGQENSSLTIRNSIFNHNTAQSGGAGALGFGCSSLSSNVLIEDSEFNNNSAGTLGGGIALSGSSISLSPEPVDSIQFTIRNTQINNNTAQDEGGGLWMLHSSTHENSSYLVTIDNCQINNNTAQERGGGLYSYSNNHIDDVNSASVKILNSDINGNSSGDDGGGIYAAGVYTVPGGLSLIIQNSNINQNTAADMGGGIYTWGYTSELELTNSTVSGNSADEGGGVCFLTKYPTPVFNHAFQIDKSTISGNTATTTGGGVYMFFQNEGIESIIARYSTLYNNNAPTGGAIFSNVALSIITYSVRLESSIMVDNGLDDLNVTSFASEGYNIFNDALVPGSTATDQLGIDSTNLNLGPLQNNGGFTLTHMPNVSSPAIDAGNPSELSAAQNWVILGIRESGAAERASVINDTLTISACDSLVSPSGNYVWTSSGTYNDTVFSTPNDTLFTVNLQIQNTAALISENVCTSSYTAPNGTIYTSTGIYFDTTTNSNGCDSVTTFDLTFNLPTSASFIENVCAQYMSPSGQVWITSGVYQDTIQNANGCDSVMTITLNINQSFASITEFVCGPNYTAPSGAIFSLSGTYQDTIPNAFGCDSIISIDLTLAAPTSGIDIVSACDSFIWINGNTYTSSNNSAEWILTNAAGCDSVITLDLTMNTSTSFTDVVIACNSFTWIDGVTYSASNNSVTHIIQNSNGCDSLITLDLTINSASANVTNNSPELIAATGATSYQWIDCLNENTPTNGETGALFLATSNGEYAVIIEENGCIDTSACFEVDNVSLRELNELIWSVYPNPSIGTVTIHLNSPATNQTIEVINSLGQVLSRHELNTLKTEIELGKESGIYFILFTTKGKQEIIPIVLIE